jgi:hypothetical protein
MYASHESTPRKLSLVVDVYVNIHEEMKMLRY